MINSVNTFTALPSVSSVPSDISYLYEMLKHAYEMSYSQTVLERRVRNKRRFDLFLAVTILNK